MSSPPSVMYGLELPDFDRWSDRVCVALGQNPGVFTGPGTNTYLVGTGSERILLDTGAGLPEYLPVLAGALEQERCTIQEIVLTHGHGDHIGGASGVIANYGALRVSKHPWPKHDELHPLEITSLSEGDVIETEGATLRAVHTPGHAVDHLCFVLEEERSLFSGDNVLGVGTTVIPAEGGDLGDYMDSLHRILSEAPTTLYPAHGPCIREGTNKVQEYIDHRNDREHQIASALGEGPRRIPEIVKVVYAAYPEALHAPAGQSVCSHLKKLEKENRVARTNDAPPIDAIWELT
ncbi:beta-lactamase-like protein 2 [Myxococcota bacterium]|nr:beta-lactamase-like protein 2 [Myxococcota bacterium]